MRRAAAGIALAAGLLATTPLRAQAPKAFEVVKIADGLYELSHDAGGYPEKVVASVGPDGLLIVDSGSRETAEALAKELAALGKGMPRIVINTHSHIEHVAGNPVVGKGAVIVGHRNLRERYLHGLYYFGDFPPGALPNLTFTDGLTIHFNGQEIRIAAFPGAHDDSDIAVLFTRSKVAVVSALCMGKHFPSIDGDRGDIRKYPEVTANLLAWLPEDVTLVPGHADDCDMAEARRFLDMLGRTGEIVRAGMAAGKSLERLKADDALAAYASYESAYVKRGDWIDYWHSALTNPPSEKPRPFEPVIRVLREKGAAAAVAAYSELRRTRPDDWWFEDMALMYMGRRLSRMERWADAAAFLDGCIREYPGSEGAAQSHAVLASVCERQGDLAAAMGHWREYLRKHPEDEEARKSLAEVERRRSAGDAKAVPNPAGLEWRPVAAFGGPATWFSAAFTIGDRAYVGTGYGARNEIWRYDPTADAWARAADLPGTARGAAVAFSIGDKGYIGLGFADDSRFSDLWEYDPTADRWSQKAPLPSAPRDHAAVLAIGGKAYVVGGMTCKGQDCGELREVWEYDPAADRWTRKGDLPEEMVWSGYFVLDGKGYIGGGPRKGAAGLPHFWEYDPRTDAWTRKADFPGPSRFRAVGFAIGGAGYIATGIASMGEKTAEVLNDVWRYDPRTDAWSRRPDFGGPARGAAAAFTVGDRVYIATGTNAGRELLRDVWSVPAK